MLSPSAECGHGYVSAERAKKFLPPFERRETVVRFIPELPAGRAEAPPIKGSVNAAGRQTTYRLQHLFAGVQRFCPRLFFGCPPGRKQMIRTYLTAAILAAVLAVPVTAFAQQGQLGTADEAKAMLMKAVAAVKADGDVALGMFNKGEADLGTAISMYSSTEPETARTSPGRFLSPAERTQEPSKTRPARSLVRNCTPQRRSRKVKSPRSAICFRSPARPHRRYRR